MQSVLPYPGSRARQLAPFFVLSLLLHLVLLFAIRLPAKIAFPPKMHQLEVYLGTPDVPEPARIPLKAPAIKQVKPATLPAPPWIQSTTPVAQPDATSPAAPPVLDTRQMIESGMEMVRNEARKAEQQIAAQEKQKLNTPLGMLMQNLKQPRKETRLANGMLKIVTDAGEVCFQPVPVFARDTPGLYGIPTTCP